jgi:hypothetical protein
MRTRYASPFTDPRYIAAEQAEYQTSKARIQRDLKEANREVRLRKLELASTETKHLEELARTASEAAPLNDALERKHRHARTDHERAREAYSVELNRDNPAYDPEVMRREHAASAEKSRIFHELWCEERAKVLADPEMQEALASVRADRDGGTP